MSTVPMEMAPFRLSGRVYGTLVNHRSALELIGDAITAAPYKAAPQAPVLYVKPRNTLAGPGHLPDFNAPHGTHAQFWFNANQTNPLPACVCGNPSSSLWMGQGFCCDEHYHEAKAKYDDARVRARLT